MTVHSQQRRRLRRVLDLAGSVLLAVLVIVVSAGAGGLIPPVGAILNTGAGVWRLSADADAAHPEDITLPGLNGPVTVGFESNGLAHVTAGTDQDLFRSIGYVHARFRLTQMDLTRRQGRGELAEVVGRDALNSDLFERDLGLRRAAERDWAVMAADDPARAVLLAYSDGVNTAIHELIKQDRLPAMFTVFDYEPRDWTPVDSLLVQRMVAQRITFDRNAVVFSYAMKAMGRKAFDEWFPTVPTIKQHPYDVGPFKKLPLTPMPVGAFPVEPVAVRPANATQDPPPPTPTPQGMGDQFGPLRDRLDKLPPDITHGIGNSNTWVVAGSRTESGKPILATDPHLDFSLPSIWYQLEGRSPGYKFSGSTTPGIPVPLLGKTDNFSWGLTASQRPTTLFYTETTDPARPDQYYRNGEWHLMTKLAEPIKVRGQATVDHQVQVTAHGPVLQVHGITVSAWWAGTLPSANLSSVLSFLRANNLQEFKESFRGWATPALNVSYADRAGNIAMFNVGVAPQVTGHDLTLPLPGDGSADVSGSIPFDALPSSTNPKEGFIVSANQREVPADYPYQYSTSYNYVLQGWRDGEIIEQLSTMGNKVTADQMAKLQSDWHDNHARQLVPLLLDALKGEPLAPNEQHVADLLAKWDYMASGDLVAPYFFESFKNRFSYNTFHAWWTDYFHAPQNPEHSLWPDNPNIGSLANEILRGTVVGWAQNDPENHYFSLPDGTKRTAKDVLRISFHEHVKFIAGKDGPDIDGKWLYGQHEFIRFPSMIGRTALQLGPYQWAGNPRTINASIGTKLDANGNPVANVSTAGATWRLVVDWGTGAARSILPGGQSENPMSPWYGNGVPLWMKGEYWPLLEGEAAERAVTVRWKVGS